MPHSHKLVYYISIVDTGAILACDLPVKFGCLTSSLPAPRDP
jgi:hypothetical protein